MIGMEAIVGSAIGREEAIGSVDDIFGRIIYCRNVKQENVQASALWG